MSAMSQAIPRFAEIGSEERQVNGKQVSLMVRHRVETGGQSVVELEAICADVRATHRVTIGAADEPLPEGYDLAQLEADLGIEKQRLAAMVEGRDRAAKLVAQLAAQRTIVSPTS